MIVKTFHDPLSPLTVDAPSWECGRMRRLRKGLLLALEGIDGSGKTTQAAALVERLRAVDLEVAASKEPTDGPWGKRIRAWAEHGRVSVEEELNAFLEDRKEHVRDLIQPALERGAVVVLDRYYYSNAAYQGARGSVAVSNIIASNEAFAPRPDLVVVLDVPVDVGLARVQKRGQANHFERPALLEASAAIFKSLLGDHIRAVDGGLTVDEVTAEVCRSVYAGPLFQAMCMKQYRTECQPAYCSYYEQCGYRDVGGLAPVKPTSWHEEVLRVSSDESLSDVQKVEKLRALAERWAGS